jgi:hypothetical protein
LIRLPKTLEGIAQMPKINGPKVSLPQTAETGKATEAKPAAEVKPAAEAKKASTLPRTSWEDGNKLGKAIDNSKTVDHPRLKHTHGTPSDPIGGDSSHHAPPIAMRYGVVFPEPNPPKPPPIAMRYGVVFPQPPDNPKPPPIAMRYGVVFPQPAPQPAPPIAMRYGVVMPGPVHPPPIAMRYGLVFPTPRDGVDTTPRPGVE